MGGIRSLTRPSKIANRKKQRRTFVKIDIDKGITNLDGSGIEINATPNAFDSEDMMKAYLSEEHWGKYEPIGSFRRLKNEFRKFMTIKNCITGALLHAVQEEDKNMPPEEVYSRGVLAMKVHEADGSYEFNIEELAKLKTLIKRRWATVSPIIVVQAFDAIDPKSKKEENKEPDAPAPREHAAVEL